MLSWCQCREQLSLTWDTNLGLYSATNFHEACPDRTGQHITGSQERHRMSTASYQLCFYSKAGPTAAECFEKGHPKSKCTGKSHKRGLLAASVLLSSGFLQAEKAEFSQKRVFGSSTSSAQCAANLLRGERVPSATCLSLRLILKCLFQDPLTKVEVEKNPRELCLCVSHCMSKAKFLLQTTFAKSVYQVIAEQKDFGWFKILVIRYSGTLFYTKNFLM